MTLTDWEGVTILASTLIFAALGLLTRRIFVALAPVAAMTIFLAAMAAIPSWYERVPKTCRPR